LPCCFLHICFTKRVAFRISANNSTSGLLQFYLETSVDIALFNTSTCIVRAAREDDANAVWDFVCANPEYELMVSGRMPSREELLHEFFHHKPPPEMPYRAVHKFVVLDASDNIVGLIDCCEDLIAKGVGHIGFFQVSTAAHGSGFAHKLYAALEAWLVSRGADSIRLGVVSQNLRSKSFWQRNGYQHVKTRDNIVMGVLSNTLYVMVKFIAPQTLAEYFARVPRDDPSQT
jgi:ribosomal protein S18 acetylase RimI-like enzyme